MCCTIMSASSSPVSLAMTTTDTHRTQTLISVLVSDHRSILDHLRAPHEDDLARKRKVKANPPVGKKKCCTATGQSEPKGVSPSEHMPNVRAVVEHLTRGTTIQQPQQQQAQQLLVAYAHSCVQPAITYVLSRTATVKPLVIVEGT